MRTTRIAKDSVGRYTVSTVSFETTGGFPHYYETVVFKKVGGFTRGMGAEVECARTNNRDLAIGTHNEMLGRLKDGWTP